MRISPFKQTGILAIGSMALLLSACGGGGSTSTSTSTNTTAFTPSDMAEFGLVSILLQEQLINMAMHEFPRLTLAARTAARNTGVSACFASGSSNMRFSDNDNSNSVSRGDTYFTTFDNCNDGYDTSYISGAVQGSILSVQGVMPDFLNGVGTGEDWGFQQAITFSNLRIVDQLDSETSVVDGSATIAAAFDDVGNLYESSVNTGNMSISSLVNGEPASFSYGTNSSFAFLLDTLNGNYALDSDFNLILAVGNESFSISYVNDPEFFGTLLSVDDDVLDAPPTEGTWFVQWDNQAPVRLTALPDGITLLAETDTGRDGIYATRETLLWSDLDL